MNGYRCEEGVRHDFGEVCRCSEARLMREELQLKKELKETHDQLMFCQSEASRLNDKLLARQREVSSLKALLKKLEWSGYDVSWMASCCPCCNGYRPDDPDSLWIKYGRPSGHLDGCELDAVIREEGAS